MSVCIHNIHEPKKLLFFSFLLILWGEDHITDQSITTQSSTDHRSPIEEENRRAQGGQYLDGVPQGEAGDGIAATEAVGDSEAVEAGVTPEGDGGRLAEDPAHLPGLPEGPLLHLAI